jgi:carbamoyl-phosphate synthase large subunit
MSAKSEKTLNILITGAGSVMGQSVFKALNFSKYKDRLRIVSTNSEPVGAVFFFNSTKFYDLSVDKTYVVPLAKDPAYVPALEKICDDEKIDLVFGGTEHEIYALAILGEKSGFQSKVVGLPLSFVDITTDKYKLGLFFEKHGLEGPKTVLYKDISTLAASHGYPLIIKPRQSSASRNITVVHAPQDLPQSLFAEPNNIVVQEYVGKATEEYTVGCYLDFVSKRDFYIVMRRILTVDGASGQGEVVANEAIHSYCKKIMAAFIKEGFPGGAFNIQLRLRNNSVPCAFEINGRFSSTEGPRAKLGFNALEASIENVVYGRAYDDFHPKIGGRFLRYYEEVYW